MVRISKRDLYTAKYGALSLKDVKAKIDEVLCNYITCDDCGGYGFDHDRNADTCNYEAMYGKIDIAKAQIIEQLIVNESLGVRCKNEKHLLSVLECSQCKKDDHAARRNK